jgi:antitoxin MazE
MSTKIQKWGNSLAVRIPKTYVDALKIEEGTDVKMKIVKNKLIVSKKKRQEIKLRELLNKVSDKNLHKEVVFSKLRDKEVNL